MLPKPQSIPTIMPATSRTSKAQATPLKTLAAQKAGVLHPEDSVETAGSRMREHDAETWPVAEDRKLVGMVDEKNPDWKMGGHGHDPKDSVVGDIMSRDVIFCYEDEDCARARQLMDEHGLQHIPVVDREMHVVGIFTREEIQMAAPNQERSEVEHRALEIARRDGRDAFTDDDLAAAEAELGARRTAQKAP